MASKQIPCDKCDYEKQLIEEGGLNEVISCKPIPNKPGWCEIKWQRKN